MIEHGDGPLAPHPTLATYFRDERERRTLVDHLFDVSAQHYDAVIGAMSFGSGRWYRRDALKRAGLGPGMDVLDLATGTGIVAKAAASLTAPDRVTGIDPSQGMLEQARRVAPLRYVRGFAESLPFQDGSFDFLSMGYALRHMADLKTTFSEARRVLRPGGRLLVLEISRARSRTGLAATRLYLGTVVPVLTGLLTRNREARRLFRYYWDTIEHCVPPETILSALREAGFETAERSVVLGIFSEYLAVKRAT
jgi:demethylmenaquinone methyltransferase/2-methoxy-6-polyprenyl-1,4-benzoquinol methylase